MRIIKLSPTDVDFKTRPMVDTYFLQTLPNRKPPGAFFLTNRAIGVNGIAPGEKLVFTYKGECVYHALAESNRRDNDGDDNVKYPHLFFVDVASIEPIAGTLSEMQAKLDQAGLSVPNLVKSRSWPSFDDDDPAAQVIDTYVSPAQSSSDAEEIAAEVLEKQHAKGQGFVLNKALRVALEKFAMGAAKAHFESQKFLCEDHSRNQPYDVFCRRSKEVLYVEVKGTQTSGEKIILTNGEVEFARKHKGQMALFVLHSIKVSEAGGEFHLTGGEMRLIHPWEVDQECLSPLSFMYSLCCG